MPRGVCVASAPPLLHTRFRSVPLCGVLCAAQYPHVTAVYWALYRLARVGAPPMTRRATWDWYLKQAVRTYCRTVPRSNALLLPAPHPSLPPVGAHTTNMTSSWLAPRPLLSLYIGIPCCWCPLTFALAPRSPVCHPGRHLHAATLPALLHCAVPLTRMNGDRWRHSLPCGSLAPTDALCCALLRCAVLDPTHTFKNT